MRNTLAPPLDGGIGITDKVFISYSHDSSEHIHQVLALSNRLRSEGVDTVLDQYEESPPEGWPRWMDREIRDAAFVLLVCTEPYYQRVMGEEVAGVGLGVRWEGNLIYQHFYNGDTLNSRFIPVVLSGDQTRFIPAPLQGATHYTLDSDEGYERLYMRLTGQTRVEMPPLGERRSLPPKEVKTDPSMYVTGPIDVELWDGAGWSAAFFMWGEGMTPVLGLGFKSEAAARQIFQSWHERYGDHDEYEELRISIIEGDVEGEEAGYSVHIGSDPDAAIRRYRAAGFDADPDYLIMIDRIHRMNPPPESDNLEHFKTHYRRSKCYLLVPGVMSEDGLGVAPIPDLGILKGVVHLRQVADIRENDLDQVILKAAGLKRPRADWKRPGRGR